MGKLPKCKFGIESTRRGRSQRSTRPRRSLLRAPRRPGFRSRQLNLLGSHVHGGLGSVGGDCRPSGRHTASIASQVGCGPPSLSIAFTVGKRLAFAETELANCHVGKSRWSRSMRGAGYRVRSSVRHRALAHAWRWCGASSGGLAAASFSLKRWFSLPSAVVAVVKNLRMINQQPENALSAGSSSSYRSTKPSLRTPSSPRGEHPAQSSGSPMSSRLRRAPSCSERPG